MGRGPTAYFMYADSVRAAVKAALVAGADPDAPNPGVATVAKAIGVQWKALTDEGRAEWKAKAAAAGAAADAARAAGGAPPTPPKPAAAPGLPLSVVRRLMMLDPDVGRVSSGAARAVVAAAEGFVALLAEAGAGVAAEERRRTVRGSDVLAASRRDGRLADACVPAAAAAVVAAAAPDAAPPKAAAADAKGKKALAPGERSVAAFFKAPAGAAEPRARGGE